MRTTIDIPDDLMRNVQKYLGLKSKRDVVVHALMEVQRREKVEEFLRLAGQIEFQPWVDKQHPRTRKKAS